jgi:hypothetical protein
VGLASAPRSATADDGPSVALVAGGTGAFLLVAGAGLAVALRRRDA